MITRQTSLSPLLLRAVPLLVLACSVLQASTTLGQLRAETITVTQPGGIGTQYMVNFTGMPAGAAITLDIDTLVKDGTCTITEDVDFANATTAMITARNTSSPAGQALKPNATAAPGMNTAPVFDFCCNRDMGQWLIEVGDGIGGAPDAVLTVNVNCPAKVPAVSDFGLVALLLLTAVAGVIVIRRSRRGHAAV